MFVLFLFSLYTLSRYIFFPTCQVIVRQEIELPNAVQNSPVITVCIPENIHGHFHQYLQNGYH